MLRWKLESASGWSLYQTSAAWDAAKAETLLGYEASPSVGQLALRECEHLVVHWESPAPANLLAFNTRREAAEDPEEVYSIETCFDWLMDTQRLSKDDAVTCDGCMQRVEALSRIQFAGMPPVLVLHLNRFRYQHGQRSRLCTPICFPLDGLNLTRFQSDRKQVLPSARASLQDSPPVYDLLASIIHAGSACVGHYMTFVRSHTGTWYLYNDEIVKPVCAEDVNDTKGAYVLFYLHRDLRPSAWGSP